jgi:hypothetical protein
MLDPERTTTTPVGSSTSDCSLEHHHERNVWDEQIMADAFGPLGQAEGMKYCSTLSVRVIADECFKTTRILKVKRMIGRLVSRSCASQRPLHLSLHLTMMGRLHTIASNKKFRVLHPQEQKLRTTS